MTSPQRFRQIEELFELAVEMPAEERAAFLLEVARDDPELRSVVASLLRADEQGTVGLNLGELIGSGGDSVQEDFKSGDQIARYRIVRKLGAGGMGVVYEALDVDLNRPVAIKFLAAHLLSDSGHARRFSREAHTAAAIQHANVCTIYEISHYEDRPFLVMELLRGETLFELLQRTRLPFDRWSALALDFSRGLAEAHHQGLVHRDVKPSNLFVTERGEGKVLDFGLAKWRAANEGQSQGLEQQITRSGTLMGTPSYMSPEQLLGEPVGAESDVFSLGTVLHEMATGEPPFDGTTPPAVINEILNGEPKSLRGAVSDLPVAVVEVIERALSRDRSDRYASIVELEQELAKAIERGQGTSLPSRFTGPSPGVRRVRPFWLAGAATLLVVLIVAWLWLGREDSLAPATRIQISSLAVLPFENLSGDPDQDYFAAGMTESLITELSRIHALRVISRRSVMRYQGTELSSREIAEDLGVDALVEGSARQEGPQAHVVVTLVEPLSGSSLWSERYRQNLDSISSVQIGVARGIAERIALELTADEERRLATSGPVDAAAYEAYLRGRYAWNERTEASVRRAIDFFEQAIVLEPNYGSAYAGLADAWLLLGDYSWESGALVLEKVEEYAAKALELEPTLAAPHAARGLARHLLGWDWQGARAELQRAIELGPNEATSRQWYAEHLNATGRSEEARLQIEAALELDPLSRIIGSMYGFILMCGGEAELAVAQFDEVLELDPDYFQAQRFRVLALAAADRLEEAKTAAESTAERFPDSSDVLSLLGYILGRVGQQAEAESLLAGDRVSFSPYQTAMIQAGLGNEHAVCEQLEAAAELRQGSVPSLSVVPWFEDYRSSECFQSLVTRLGLGTAISASQ